MTDAAEKGAVCVTGAAGGIGVALVHRLLAEGYAVFAWDLEPGPLATIGNDRFVFCALDVRDKAAVGDAVADARRRFGAIDGLVTLAAIYVMQDFLALDEATWDRHFSINLKGPLFAVQAVLPIMRAQKSGSIVLFSSMLARVGGVRSAAYAATKGGVLGLARAVALEAAPDNVRVNTISPGIVETAMPRVSMGEEAMYARTAAIPMGRLGSPEEMAEATLFLLDPQNGFMLGQDLRLTGGYCLF